MSSLAEDLVVGAVGMHCHHGPDPHRERSVDAAEAGMSLFRDEMLQGGLSVGDVDAIARRNPARLLGLA